MTAAAFAHVGIGLIVAGVVVLNALSYTKGGKRLAPGAEFHFPNVC